MSDALLREVAALAGLAPTWTDYGGRTHTVEARTLEAVLDAMGLPADTVAAARASRDQLHSEREVPGDLLTTGVGKPTPVPGAMGVTGAHLALEDGSERELALTAGGEGPMLPPIEEAGYHRLDIGGRRLTLAVAPVCALRPTELTGRRKAFGLAAQIYALPPAPGEAFGDFGALARFAEDAAVRGADVLAMSPTHALFAADPGRYSPYAPSTRLLHNVLYADPAALFADAFTAKDEAPAAQVGGLIDWPEAGSRKMTRLRACWRRFQATNDADLARAYADFCRRGGLTLERHAVFEALHVYFFKRDGTRGWPGWPATYHDPAGAAVADFARKHSDEVAFHTFLQWLAEHSLERAQARARGAGMAIGLIADLAVGMDGGGSHAWSRPDDVLHGVSIGAPPDPLGPHGQGWGLTTFSPRALRRRGFAPFLETLRAAMRSTGGVRIDHVMGLARLWVIPDGMTPDKGVYLSYPLDDMLRLVALESHRNRAIVIGEDLGTVPPGFRERLDEAGILGMRVLWFERTRNGGFRAPGRWGRRAVAMTTTHDLPTVAGWWRGNDIAWRARVQPLEEAGAHDEQRQTRERDKARLWAACAGQGIVGGDTPQTDDTRPIVDAALDYVAATACDLAIVPAEDILGLVEQPNLPGTTDEHPNWRRRLPAADLSGIDARARMARLARARPGKRGLPQ